MPLPILHNGHIITPSLLFIQQTFTICYYKPGLGLSAEREVIQSHDLGVMTTDK